MLWLDLHLEDEWWLWSIAVWLREMSIDVLGYLGYKRKGDDN